MIELLKQPWPWYVSGALIGLIVPLLLILGNKNFGISPTLRHVCAACFPANIQFFKYDWKRELWNLYFITGILIGGFIASKYLSILQQIDVSPELVQRLAQSGVSDYSNLVPEELFSFKKLFTPRGFIMMVVGGFLIGFGSRYAGGCTSGHLITGLSTLQSPSLIATICFLIGGFIMTNILLPYILSL
jgi:uncharacterized membrane protein YedE/YeeE